MISVFFLDADLPEADFTAFCQLSLTGRRHFENRIALIARSPDEAITLLQKINESNEQLLSALDAAELNADLVAIAKKYLAGEAIEWDSSANKISRQIIQLPTYPFQRKRYWLLDD